MIKHKIIANPVSGKGEGEKSIPQIKQNLLNHNLEFEIVKTERPWHAVELAQQAVIDGFEVVVAAGGDGTVNEVINGIMLEKERENNSVTMGVLTVGRGNDFAFGAKIPINLDESCALLAKGNSYIIDVGKVTGGLFPQGRFFGNGVGIGFDAIVGFEADKFKYLSGFPAYAAAAIKTIFLYHKGPLLQIEFNEKTLTQNSLMVSIMNGRRMGGGFMMAPNAENNDGFFDLCIAGVISRPRLFPLFPKFLKGTQEDHDAIQTYRTSKIIVTAIEGAIPAHADGETLCETGEKLEIKIIPNALDIICNC